MVQPKAGTKGKMFHCYCVSRCSIVIVLALHLYMCMHIYTAHVHALLIQYCFLLHQEHKKEGCYCFHKGKEGNGVLCEGAS